MFNPHTHICTLTDASLSLETAQELSRVLNERTRALQQQLNCSTETSGVVYTKNIVHYAMQNKCAPRVYDHVHFRIPRCCAPVFPGLVRSLVMGIED